MPLKMFSSYVNQNMRSILILSVFILFKICNAFQDNKRYPYRECIPKNYFWQPSYGAIPTNALRAGTDKNGEHKYVARVVSCDDRSWLTPVTFSETANKNMWLNFGWQGQEHCKITHYIEIFLVSNPNHGLRWYRVNSDRDLYDYKRECCLVEGGHSYKDGKEYTVYIGRTYEYGSYFIGGVYIKDWNNRMYMQYMNGLQCKYIETHFDVLGYHCCKNVICIPKPSFYDPCCADYYGRQHNIRGSIH